MAIPDRFDRFAAASAEGLAQAAHARVAAAAGVEARIEPDRMANAIRAPAMDTVERAVPPDFVGMRRLPALYNDLYRHFYITGEAPAEGR